MLQKLNKTSIASIFIVMLVVACFLPSISGFSDNLLIPKWIAAIFALFFILVLNLGYWLTGLKINFNFVQICMFLSIVGGVESLYAVAIQFWNISFDQSTNTINVKNEGEGYITLGIKNQEYIENTYSFNVIDEGVNVYSFNDLMMCTNKSQNGEVVVMQVNLESRVNALNKDTNGNYIDEYKQQNTKLFGNYSRALSIQRK